MLTVTVATDRKGRVVGLIVPRGTQVQIANDDGEQFYPFVPDEGTPRSHLTSYNLSDDR